MLELEEARRQILAAIHPLPAETVALADADGRFLAENVVSKINLPAFDNSAMDGFAVQSSDLASVNRERPIPLRLVGKIPAGEIFSGTIESGECARIFTGSPLPSGADAVVMQEDTKIDSNDPETVLFLDSVKPWENIRFQGEDVKVGDILAKTGTRFGARHLGLLGAAGISGVQVARKPMIGLIATGSELREAGQPIAGGEIYESNRAALAAMTKRAGAMPKIYPLVPDTLDGTKAILKNAFTECDAVISTGGVSVGELDFVKAAFEQLGGQLDFWKVSIKPGKPFVFGQLGGKFLFGLPGNPVSAFVTFVVLVAPALARLQGATEFSWPSFPGMLTEPLQNRGDRRHFVRVFANEKGEAKSAGTQASHILSALAKANGLVEVPPNATLAAGSRVSVLTLD